MKPFLFLLLCLFPSTLSAQYTRTANGYLYKGRHYVIGEDLPRGNCQCEMCRTLRAAYGSTPVCRAETVTTTRLPIPDKVAHKNIPTPQHHIDEMLRLLSPRKNSVFLDPGCGDARFLTTAAINYGVRGVGIEINLDTANIARRNVEQLLLQNQVHIVRGDSIEFSFEGVDFVVLYLYPELIEKLRPKFTQINPGGIVLSYEHSFSGSHPFYSTKFHFWQNKQ